MTDGFDLAKFSRLSMERNRTTFAPAHTPLALVACIAEEVGEVAQAVLGSSGLKARKAHLTTADVGREIADAVTYLDLLATTMGLYLGTLLANRFDEVSMRANSDIFYDDDCRRMQALYDSATTPPRKRYAICCNSAGYVFAKEWDYFEAQGGTTESWGANWKQIKALSIEDARRIGCETLPGALPYDRQAK